MNCNFTYIDDIVDGIIKVIDNLAYSTPNLDVEKEMLLMQDGNVVSTFSDVNGLINEFNYKPDTNLADGIGEFVKWYKDFHKENNEV